jgi:hypothetical protein
VEIAGQQLRKLEALYDHRWLYEIVGGQWNGCTCVGPPGLDTASGRRWATISSVRPFHRLDVQEQRAAAHAADALLCSLLDATQRAEFDRDRKFWVETSDGRFLLGAMYDIRARWQFPTQEMSVCVVPAGWEQHPDETPSADFWINVLLMLLHDRLEFGRVARVRTDFTRLTPTAACSWCDTPLQATRWSWSCQPCFDRWASRSELDRLHGNLDTRDSPPNGQ